MARIGDLTFDARKICKDYECTVTLTHVRACKFRVRLFGRVVNWAARLILYGMRAKVEIPWTY